LSGSINGNLVRVNYQLVIEADNNECCLDGFKRLVIPLFLNPNVPLNSQSQIPIPNQQRPDNQLIINNNFNASPAYIPGNGIQPNNQIYYPNPNPNPYNNQIPIGAPIGAPIGPPVGSPIGPPFGAPVGAPNNEISNNLFYPNIKNDIYPQNNFNNVPRNPQVNMYGSQYVVQPEI
jgi:hypothetical protein